MALKDDPKYAQYFKMLSMHLPKGAVVQKMMKDGVDSSILDADPDKPAPAGTGSTPAASKPALPSAPPLSGGGSFLDEIKKGKALKKPSAAPKPAGGGMSLLDQIQNRPQLKSAAPIETQAPPSASNMASAMAAGRANLKSASDRDVPEQTIAKEDPGANAYNKMLSAAAAKDDASKDNDSDGDEWEDDADGGRNSIVANGARQSFTFTAGAAPALSQPPAPKAGGSEATSTALEKTSPAPSESPATLESKSAAPLPAPSMARGMFGAMAEEPLPSSGALSSEALSAGSKEPSSGSKTPSPSKRKSLMQMADEQELKAKKEQEVVSDPAVLQARVVALEQQLRGERIKVRQLQNRLRGSNSSNPQVKLDKALKLVVKLMGKDRLEQHLADREQNGKSKGFAQSLAHVYRAESRKDPLQKRQTVAPRNKVTRKS